MSATSFSAERLQEPKRIIESDFIECHKVDFGAAAIPVPFNTTSKLEVADLLAAAFFVEGSG